MSAGALDPALAGGGADDRAVFFKRVMDVYKRAEKNSDREAFSYTAIGLILQKHADACTSSDDKHSVCLDIQPRIKGPEDTECSPDFTSNLVPTWQPPQDYSEPPSSDAPICLWEVKSLLKDDWFGHIATKRTGVLAFAQQSLKSYLKQLSGQALYAFNQYKCDTMPVFLSQGNCFTFLLYDRPDNWDMAMGYSAETPDLRPPQSSATGQPESDNSNTTSSQEQETPSGAQEQGTTSGQQEAADDAVVPGDSSTDYGVSPTADEEGKNGQKAAADDSDASSSNSTEFKGRPFQKGDVLIPRLMYSCEFIMLPDGSGFTPQFLKALRIAMAIRGVAFKPSDCIFSLPEDQPLDDIPRTQSLATANAAIKAFNTEQNATDEEEQWCSTTSSASAASSDLNYTNPRSAIIRPPDGLLWNLRDGTVNYKSPRRKTTRKEPVLGRQPAKRPRSKRAKSSKETTLHASQDAPATNAHVNAAAGLANAHVATVAGPPNVRAVPLRPAPKSRTQGVVSSRNKLDQIQEDPVVPVPDSIHAGPSKKRGTALRAYGRRIQSAVQDTGHKLKPSESAPAVDTHVNEAAAGPSNKQKTGRATGASTGNTKKPGQGTRKGKERAH